MVVLCWVAVNVRGGTTSACYAHCYPTDCYYSLSEKTPMYEPWRARREQKGGGWEDGRISFVHNIYFEQGTGTEDRRTGDIGGNGGMKACMNHDLECRCTCSCKLEFNRDTLSHSGNPRRHRATGTTTGRDEKTRREEPSTAPVSRLPASPPTRKKERKLKFVSLLALATPVTDAPTHRRRDADAHEPWPVTLPVAMARWSDGAMERCGCCGWMLHDDTMTQKPQKPQKPQKLHTSRVLVTVKPCLHSVPNTVNSFGVSVRADDLPSLFLLARFCSPSDGSLARLLLLHRSSDQSLPFSHQELMSFLYSHTYIRRSLVVGRLLQIKQNQAHAKVGGNVNPEGRPREDRITANGG